MREKKILVSDIQTSLSKNTKRKICEWVVENLLGWTREENELEEILGKVYCFTKNGIVYSGNAPHYLSSIDSALALSEKLGFCCNIDARQGRRFKVQVNVWRLGPGGGNFMERGDDLAPAILRCLLRAMNVTEIEI